MTTSQPLDASQPDQPTQAPIAQQAAQPAQPSAPPTASGAWALPPAYAPYPMYTPPPPPPPLSGVGFLKASGERRKGAKKGETRDLVS
jgi:hypothetical protein